MKLKLKNPNGTYSITDDSVRDVQINGINTNLVAMQNVTGAKNIVDLPDATITSSGYVFRGTPIYLPAGSYILTFDFNGTSGAQSQFLINDTNDTTTLVSAVFAVKNGTNEVSFTLAPTETGASAYYYTHGVGDYSKFMIRPDGTDSTYVKHAMSNAELTKNVESRYHEVTELHLLANGGQGTVDISKLSEGHPYIVMCNGQYNPLWRYLGLLCYTTRGYLFDVVTDATLSVSVSDNTITLTNNNFENDQKVTLKIIG